MHPQEETGFITKDHLSERHHPIWTIRQEAKIWNSAIYCTHTDHPCPHVLQYHRFAIVRLLLNQSLRTKSRNRQASRSVVPLQLPIPLALYPWTSWVHTWQQSTVSPSRNFSHRQTRFAQSNNLGNLLHSVLINCACLQYDIILNYRRHSHNSLQLRVV